MYFHPPNFGMKNMFNFVLYYTCRMKWQGIAPFWLLNLKIFNTPQRGITSTALRQKENLMICFQWFSHRSMSIPTLLTCHLCRKLQCLSCNFENNHEFWMWRKNLWKTIKPAMVNKHLSQWNSELGALDNTDYRQCLIVSMKCK